MRQVLKFLAVGMLLFAEHASAQSTRSAAIKENRAFIYHGKLVRPDGTTPTGSIPVTLKILSPDPHLCVLWVEKQTVAVTNGGFSIEIGHAVHRLSGPAGGAAADFKQAFINNPGLTISSAQCEQGNSYTPTTKDDRLLSATFDDAGAPVEITGLPIKSVPFAMQAEEIGGYGLANLVKISGAGNNATLTPAQIDELKAMSDTTLPFDMKARAVKNAADPVDLQDVVTKAYYQANLPSGTGNGTVTNVSASSGPLTVANGTSSPVISIAQAGAATDGYLTAANWNTFNGKLSSTLAQDRVFIGNASNVATAGYFGIEQLRNNAGNPQFPAACAASQTMVWNAITDVLLCADINNLNADKITAGTLATARLGTGVASTSTYLRGDQTWAAIPPGADDLGNHTATTNLNLGAHQLVGNGGASGISVSATGNVGIGTTSPSGILEVAGGTAAASNDGTNITITAQNAGTGNKNGGNIILTPGARTGIGQPGVIQTSGNLDITANSILTMSDAGSTQWSLGKLMGSDFSLYANGAAGNVLFANRTTGNVGIGVTSPSEKLEVAGNIKGTQLCIGSDCRSSWPSGGGGSVTGVSSVNADIGVTNGSTSPSLTLNSGTAGGAGDANKIAKLDGGGLLNVAMIPNFSATKITSGTLAIAQGGTNSGATLNNNRLMISSGGAIVENSAITGNRALASNASGIPVALTVTDTELGYLSGVTSNVQTQLGNKQASNAELSGLAAIAATGIVQRTGAGTYTALGTTAPLTVTAGNLAMTYTPVNKAGDTMTGALNLASNGLAVGTNQLVVSGGNVGVGTSCPAVKLDVNGTINATAMTINGVPIGGSSGPVTFFEGFETWTGTNPTNTPSGWTRGGSGGTQTSASNVVEGALSAWLTGSSSYLERSIDVTGFKTLRAHVLVGTSNASIKINGTNVWTQSGAMALSQISVDISAYTGTVTLQLHQGAIAGGASFYIDALTLVSDNPTVWAESNGLAYRLGNVGIGTSSPQASLHVNGVIRATDICDETGANCKDISGGWAAGGVAGSDTQIQYNSGGVLSAVSNFTWNQASKTLSIAGNTASAILDVSSTAGASTLNLKSTDSTRTVSFLTNTSKRWNLTTSTAGQELGANSGSDFSIDRFDDAGTALGSSVFVKRSTGNVGIGTTSPGEKLEVAGNIKGTQLCIGSDCRGSWPSGGGGSVTGVSSVNADIGVTNGSTSPSLTLNSGTAGGAGDANKIAKLDAGGLLNVAMIPNFSAAKITSGTLAIAQGGTNSGATLNNNRLMISSGGAIVENSAITGNRALASNASGIPVALTVTDTELGYLSGVTSSVQTQLGNKQASNAELSGLAAIAATGIVQRTGAGTYTALGTTTPLTVTGGNLAMTYTPVNKAGDTMTGALNLPANGLSVGTHQLVVSLGNVGIGTTTPGANTKLSVFGQIHSKSSSTASAAIDFTNGNAISTSFDCGSSISFANLRDGGSYTVAVTGAGTTVCTFDTVTTGDDAATVSYRFLPANNSRTASSHTLYSLQRIGNVVYVSWMTGF